MPTPRYSPAVSAASAPKAQSPQATNYAITTETVEGDAGGGRYLIRGTAIPARGSLQLATNDRVAVQWRGGLPLVILNLQSRRGPSTDEPFGGGGIVEELVIAARLVDGVVDVHFRNDRQVTPLKVREMLPSDPVAVRWGANERSFVVQTGNPAPPDFWSEFLTFSPFVVHTPSRAPQDQKYHVFKMKGSDKKVLGATKPSGIELLATHQPSTSALVMIAASGDKAASSMFRQARVEKNSTGTGTQGIFSISATHDGSAVTTGTGGALSITLADLLAQTWGPCAVADFGLDRDNHLLVSVRARPEVSVLVPVGTTGVNIAPTTPANCGWTDTPISGSGFEAFATTPGEGHAWAVDVTAGVVVFRTNEAAAVLVDRAAQSGTFDTSVTIAHDTQDGSCGFGNLGWSTTIDPAASYTAYDYDLGGGGATPRRKKDLWDEARFSFIPAGSLDQAGTVGSAHLGPFYVSIGTIGVSVEWDEPVTTYPSPHPPHAYYIRQLSPLRGPPSAAPPLRLFLGMYRATLATSPPTMQYAAFVVELDGTVVRTLKDWTTMQTFAQPSFPSDPQPPFGYETHDMLVNYVHDGSQAELVGGNFEHVLWAYSTKDERAAQTAHVVLTQLSTGAEKVDGGTDLAKLTPHDFRMLNLDLLYKAKPEDKTDAAPKGRYFVRAWNAKTGAPTLDQAAANPNYPIEDKSLSKVAGLKNLEALAPVVGDYQAVNDASATGGRKLTPTPGDKGK